MADVEPLGTRARLLEAATTCFARSGFEGTSVSAILTEASVNKRMLYHHFGSKAGLYREVFASQWRAFADTLARRLEAPQAQARSGRALLIEALQMFFDHMATHTHFARLMMWEGLEGGAISRSLWDEVSGPLFGQIMALIERAQQEGSLCAQLHPGHVVISSLGMVLHYFGYAGSLSDLTGQAPGSPEGLAERREQLTLFFEQVFGT